MVSYCREAETSRSCRVMGRQLRVHFKNTYETGQAIKGMGLPDAQKYLNAVISHKRCIPFRRFNGNIGRTAQAKEFGVDQGRWPEKSCRFFLNLLKNAEAIALNKKLSLDKMYIWHVCVNRAQKGRRRKYCAHGKINPYLSHPCHIEMILKEKALPTDLPDKAPQTEAQKVIRLTKKQLAHRRLKVNTVSSTS